MLFLKVLIVNLQTSHTQDTVGSLTGLLDSINKNCCGRCGGCGKGCSDLHGKCFILVQHQKEDNCTEGV